MKVSLFLGAVIFLITKINAERPFDFPDDGSSCDFLNSLANTPGYIHINRDFDINSGADDARKFLNDAINSIPPAQYPLWNISSSLLSFTLSSLASFPCVSNSSFPGFPFLPFTAVQEGPVSAPRSHQLVYRNDAVDVLKWTLKQGVREEYHTHGLASIMWLLNPAGRDYYDLDSGSSPASSTGHVDVSTAPISVSFSGPEFLHSIMNTDDHTYDVIRIEFKPQGTTKYHWPNEEILG